MFASDVSNPHSTVLLPRDYGLSHVRSTILCSASLIPMRGMNHSPNGAVQIRALLETSQVCQLRFMQIENDASSVVRGFLFRFFSSLLFMFLFCSLVSISLLSYIFSLRLIDAIWISRPSVAAIHSLHPFFWLVTGRHDGIRTGPGTDTGTKF